MKSCLTTFVPLAFASNAAKQRMTTGVQRVQDAPVPRMEARRDEYICEFCNQEFSYEWCYRCDRCQARKEDEEEDFCKVC